MAVPGTNSPALRTATGQGICASVHVYFGSVSFGEITRDAGTAGVEPFSIRLNTLDPLRD